MESEKEYFAFISYKSEDVEWATWLQHELEHYHLPASFNGRIDVPQELRPIFRDIDELSAGNLPEQIKQALANSQNLIVICSPQSAKSPWVNQEVETFIDLGRTGRIFPFIVEGVSPSEFFPPALLNLPKNEERLGGDVSKKGRDAAFVKVVAGMLGVGFDSLWNRYEKEKAEEERKQREQRDNLLSLQSRFVAEKALKLIDDGDSYTARLLSLNALPHTIENPNRPYVVEAEIALRKAFQDDNILLKGHSGSVSSISISPDGNFLASASFDNFICLWDIQTGRCIHKFEKPSIRIGKFNYEVIEGLIDEINYLGFNSVSFSPDGKYLISAGRDSAIYAWDITTKECIEKIYSYDIHFPINVVKYSPNGKLIISGGEYLNEEHEGIPGLSFWDSTNGQYLFCRETKGSVYDMCFSHDGKKLATIEYNHIHIWNTENYGLLAYYGYRTKSRNSISHRRIVFSPKGNIIASSSDDTIRIWELETGKQIQSFGIRNIDVKSLAFSANGELIYSGGKDGKIYVWDIQSGKCIRVLNSHGGDVNDIKVSSTGKYLITGSDDRTIRLVDMLSDKTLISFKIPSDLNNLDNPWCKMLGNYKLIIDKTGNIEILDAYSHKLITTFSFKNQNSDIFQTYSADNAVEASYDIDGNYLSIKNKKYDLYYSLDSPHLSEVHYIVFSPNGKELLTLSYDKDICLYRNLPQSEQEIKVEEDDFVWLRGHYSTVRWASFSSDGNYIVSVSDDATIRIWDLVTCNCIQTINTDDELLDYVDFTVDGRYVVSKNYHNDVKIWAFKSLQELINETNYKFQTRQLTSEERKKYYIE